MLNNSCVCYRCCYIHHSPLKCSIYGLLFWNEWVHLTITIDGRFKSSVTETNCSWLLWSCVLIYGILIWQKDSTPVSNIFNTYIAELHKILFKGVMKTVGIPSPLKCKRSMPKSFEEFSSARIVMDATEITQDVPSNMNSQSLSYSNY